MFTASFTLASEGTHAVQYYSTDVLGHAESTQTARVIVDITPPGPPASLLANGANPSPWSNTGVYTLAITTPSDASGVAFAMGKACSVPRSNADGAPLLLDPSLLTFSAPCLINGDNLTFIWLVDHLGNQDYRNAGSIDFRFDTIAPNSYASLNRSTFSAAPIPVGFAASDPGADAVPPTGSGVLRTSLWFRRDHNGDGNFGAWQQSRLVAMPGSVCPGCGPAQTSGAFNFYPSDYDQIAPDGAYQFYTQAFDAAGNSEPAPTVASVPTAETFFDNTPPVISNVAFPFIDPTIAELDWTTDDQTTGYVDYGTMTAYGFRVSISTLARVHAAFLDGSLLYPARIFFKITAVNRTELQTSFTGSFTTPISVSVPTDIFGVINASQPITVQFDNPALASGTFTVDGESGTLNLAASSTFQILVDPSLTGTGTQNLDIMANGFDFISQFIVDTAARSVRLARLATDAGGGAAASTQTVVQNGVPQVAGSMLDATMGQAAQGPPSDQYSVNYSTSGNSRLYWGYYAGIDPVAPGAVTNLSAVPGPIQGQATLTWTAPGNDAYVGQAMIYDLRQSTMPILDANFYQAAAVSISTLPAIAGTTQQAVVGGLVDATTYFFALKTLDGLNNASAISNAAAAMTFDVAKSTDILNGRPTVELISSVGGISINLVSTTTVNPAVALATSAAAAQGLEFVSRIYDILSPVNPLPGGASIQFQFDPTGFSSTLLQQLRIYHFNVALGSWTLVADVPPGLNQDFIVAPVTSLSFFAIMIRDTIPPVTTLQFQNGRQYLGPGGVLFASTPTAFGFAATDPPVGRLPGTGVLRTEYRIDSALIPFTPLDPASPFLSLPAGLHDLQFRSVDRAGNVEATHSVAIGIDNAPSVALLSAATGPYQLLPDGILILSTFSAQAVPGFPAGGPPVLLVQLQDPLTLGGPPGQGSGVSTVTYSLDGGSFTLAGSSFAVPMSIGLHFLRLIAQDNVGNALDRSTSPFRVVVGDIEPPRTALSISTPQAAGMGVLLSSVAASTAAPVVFVTSRTVFNLSSIDDLVQMGDGVGLGVAFQNLSVDGVFRAKFQNPSPAPGQVFSSSFTLSTDAEGVHVVSFFAQDVIQNTEAVHLATVAVDNTPPATDVSFAGPCFVQVSSGASCVPGTPLNAQVFIASTTQIVLTARDPASHGVASGVLATRYRIDQGSWTVYGAPFLLPGEGLHALDVQSQDRVLNTETVRTTLIAVDATPSATTLNIGAPRLTAFTLSIITSSTPITLTAMDPISSGVAVGVATITYRIDLGPLLVYNSTFTLIQGMHTIDYGSVDRVQNAEARKSLTVAVGDFSAGAISGVNSVSASGTPDVTGLVESNGLASLAGNAAINGDVKASSVALMGGASVTGTITQGVVPLIAEPISIDFITPLAQAASSNALIPAAFLSNGVLNVSSGKTLVLSTGIYIVQGLNINGGGSIVANGPVNILVQGPVQINGGGQANVNGPASNFVVFTTTSQATAFSGGAQAVGIFYGPRGPLDIGGNAQIGGHLFAQSAAMHGNSNLVQAGDSLPGASPKTAGKVSAMSLARGAAPALSLGADPAFTLRDVYAFPNPAVRGAKPTIHVAIGIADQVTIRIYDIAGREVGQATLDNAPSVINDGSGPKYAYEYAWDGRIPSGTYLYTIQAEKSGFPPIRKSGKFAVVR